MAEKNVSSGSLNIAFRVRLDPAFGWYYDIEITDSSGNLVGRGASTNGIQDAISATIAAVNLNVTSHDTTPELAQQAVNYLSTHGVSELTNLKGTVSVPAQPTPTPIEPITPPTITPSPAAPVNNLTGSADGDSGQGTKTTPGQTKGPSSTGSSTPTNPTSATTTGNNPTDANAATSASWIPQGWCEEYVDNMTIVKPGRRLKNPLSYLASYTYQISLYMITPDAHEAFVKGGRKNINAFIDTKVKTSTKTNSASSETNIKGGAYLIAQSGGVDTTGGEQRAPGFNYDLGIDNLKFRHLSSAKASGSSIADIEFTFNIFEPYGFSFISKLKYANAQINAYGTLPDAIKNLFVLGIRFYGWDQDGRQVKGTDIHAGTQLDPNSSGTALFETFYDIIITNVAFKLDGKLTTYTIKASPVSTSAVNIRRGMNTIQTEVAASSVHEALCGPEGLLTKINLDLKKKANASKTKETPIKFQIRWLGDASRIATATLRSDAETNKSSTPGSSAKDTTQSNDGVAIKAQPKTNNKRVSFSSNMPIVQLIENVILQSSFIDDALTVRYTDATENDPASGKHAVSKPSSNSVLTWYNISPKLSDLKWNATEKDWAYTLTYEIQTYYIPVIDNAYVDKSHPYYGPHKRYSYWYTGLNTEVIGYSAQVNNLFFTIQLDSSGNPTNPSTDSGNASNNPSSGGIKATGMQAPQVENSGGGQGSQAASSLRTSLYDPDAYINATIDVVGDPDFLMQPTTDSVNGLYNKHYGADGYTVNSTGGQVFFDIDFKEGVDYSTSAVNAESMEGQGGTLATNNNIFFWDYPEEYTKPDPATGKPLVQGLNYMLVEVTSTFNHGSFTQRLAATINPLGSKAAENADQRKENEAAANPQTAPAADGKGTTTPNPSAETAPNPAPGGSPPAPIPANKVQLSTPTGPNGTSVASEP